MKEIEKVGKEKSNGKKKVKGGDYSRGYSIVDLGLQMESKTCSGIKRKAVLQELTKKMVRQGTRVIVIGDDEEVNIEKLILYNSIIDVM